jgi:ribulose-phosphate 3-epimerase
MSENELTIDIGVKSDPIEYRYTYEWLFRIMADEGVRHLQLGTFFEIYQLPDEWFLQLRRQAESFGISISSIFTAHRELGGFFRNEVGWEAVARRNYARLVEVGGLVGAKHVGSNPGAILRDEMGTKTAATARYVANMKELMVHAGTVGVEMLTIEPMSCLAEPPTLVSEIQSMAGELEAHHRAMPGTSGIGFCIDTSHGWADHDGVVRETPEQLITASLPWLAELHLKNTDALFNSTFGFSEAERARGIVDLALVRDLLNANATVIPLKKQVAYLEIGGPKLGRDYSDCKLEDMLRASISHIKEVFAAPSKPETVPVIEITTEKQQEPVLRAGTLLVAPSIMCADLLHLEESVRRLEAVNADLLHIDVMDAHFTPNMPLGFEAFKQLRSKTSMPFDAHLMVNKNDFFVEQMAELGAWMVSVHVESAVHLDRTLGRIRKLGMKAGAALNPATSLSALEYVLDRLDFVLLMTVNPGYAGQRIVPYGLRKIVECRAWLDSRGSTIPIQVDGNVSFELIEEMTAAGADILVAGTSSVYHKDGTLAENVQRTREIAGYGLARRNTTMR